MNDLISTCLWVLIWYCIFKSVAAIWDWLKLKKSARDLESDIHVKLENLVHSVKPEQHADTEYWFDEDTDRFFAQGQTLDEIREHLKQRFTLDVFMVDDKMLLAGPEYVPMDISNSNPDQIGKYIADHLLPKILPGNENL